MIKWFQQLFTYFRPPKEEATLPQPSTCYAVYHKHRWDRIPHNKRKCAGDLLVVDSEDFAIGACQRHYTYYGSNYYQLPTKGGLRKK